MAEAEEVCDFVRTDCIDYMLVKAYNDGDLDHLVSSISMCETRINLTHVFVMAARAHRLFSLMLPFNPKWHTTINTGRTHKNWRESQSGCSRDSCREGKI